MKTPAIGEALKPLHRLEVEASKQNDEEAAQYKKAHHEWELKRDAADHNNRAALRKKPPDPLTSFNEEEPSEPVARRYVTNDTTYEKLGEILAQNPNGVLAHRDELVRC